jgi:hypothetical protein
MEGGVVTDHIPSAPEPRVVIGALQDLGGYRVSTRDVADFLGYTDSQVELRKVREVLYALYMGGVVEKPMYRRKLWTLTEEWMP